MDTKEVKIEELKTGVSPKKWGRDGWSSLKCLAYHIDKIQTLTEHVVHMNLLKLFLLCVLPCQMCRRNVVRHLRDMERENESFARMYFVADGCKKFIELLYVKVNTDIGKDRDDVIKWSTTGFEEFNAENCSALRNFLTHMFKNYTNVNKHTQMIQGFVYMIHKFLPKEHCHGLKALCFQYADGHINREEFSKKINENTQLAFIADLREVQNKTPWKMIRKFLHDRRLHVKEPSKILNMFKASDTLIQLANNGLYESYTQHAVSSHVESKQGQLVVRPTNYSQRELEVSKQKVFDFIEYSILLSAYLFTKNSTESVLKPIIERIHTYAKKHKVSNEFKDCIEKVRSQSLNDQELEDCINVLLKHGQKFINKQTITITHDFLSYVKSSLNDHSIENKESLNELIDYMLIENGDGKNEEDDNGDGEGDGKNEEKTEKIISIDTDEVLRQERIKRHLRAKNMLSSVVTLLGIMVSAFIAGSEQSSSYGMPFAG